MEKNWTEKEYPRGQEADCEGRTCQVGAKDGGQHDRQPA